MQKEVFGESNLFKQKDRLRQTGGVPLLSADVHVELEKGKPAHSPEAKD